MAPDTNIDKNEKKEIQKSELCALRFVVYGEEFLVVRAAH